MPALLRALLRFWSYLFQAGLSLFLLALALVALAGGNHNWSLAMLPWGGERLTRGLLVAGSAGLATAVLAVAGKWRVLFFAWNLVVALVLARGYFLSGYHFADQGELNRAAWLAAGSLAALAGAWSGARARRERGRKRRY
ncbi:MAG: hypothetical protein FJW37_00630 [Acidobacteria bacterium]|nr:hypothetical protein [Acidobacteriota bacterium]